MVRLTQFAQRFDREFAAYLRIDPATLDPLADAIRYAALAPGKRLRLYLVVRCCELCGGQTDVAWPVAAAVECIHAFSLVHDDLPAMDDDDLRRGQPTCHKKFGEAMAILAGDALAVMAFEMLATNVAQASMAVSLCRELAAATGRDGMIGGQAVDILSESQPPDLALTESIHLRKTAALFRAACRMGAIAGSADVTTIERLGRYGEKLGRAFQIADDLLDVTATAEGVGKTVGKDAGAGKQTHPRSVGILRSREIAAELVTGAVAELDPFGSAADDLGNLARYAIERPLTPLDDRLK